MPPISRLFDVDVESTADSRSAASGAMREARSAGQEAGEQRRADADDHGDDDRAGGHHDTVEAEVEAGAVHDRLQPDGEPVADGEAGERGDGADHDRLADHRRQHLAAGRAERPQQCRLAAALGDEDRERVVDAERGDHEGDHGERQQDGLEHAEEVALDLGHHLVGQLGAGEGLGVGRHRRGDVVAQLVLAHAVVCGDTDRRHLAGSADELGRRVVGERGVGHRARAVGAAERGDPDDRDVDRLGHLDDGRDRRRGDRRWWRWRGR